MGEKVLAPRPASESGGAQPSPRSDRSGSLLRNTVFRILLGGFRWLPAPVIPAAAQDNLIMKLFKRVVRRRSAKQTPFHLFLDAALKTVAYLRVSARSQDLANQKLAILEFSQKRRFPIDQFIESRISSRKSPLERRIDEMLGMLQPGDRLLVSELSRLGRPKGALGDAHPHGADDESTMSGMGLEVADAMSSRQAEEIPV